MKCQFLSLLVGIPLFLVAQQPTPIQTSLAQSDKTLVGSDRECMQMLLVESPVGDTYTSLQADSISFGREISMRLRGTPEKKAMISLLTFDLEHLETSAIERCLLKVYTVSRQKQPSSLQVYGLTGTIDEDSTFWFNQPNPGDLLGSKNLDDQPFIEYDVTKYVNENLPSGHISFCLQSDCKRPVEISTRESGLGSELILQICSPEDYLARSDRGEAGGYGLEILPSDLAGKFTVELIGVPAGGFGDLMILNEHGDIIRQIPLAIRKGEILHHTIDYGRLIPGNYWAVFRKGRIMIKDEFRIKPSQKEGLLLEVAYEDSP